MTVEITEAQRVLLMKLLVKADNTVGLNEQELKDLIRLIVLFGTAE